MSESGSIEPPRGHGDEPAATVAPALPVEGHVVRCVRSAEALKAQIDTLLMLVEHLPRDHARGFAAVNEAVRLMNATTEAYRAYAAVRTCEGQC